MFTPVLDRSVLSQLAKLDRENRITKLEQQVRDALFSRSTAHLGEHRILRTAFSKFDKDGSGSVDQHEFAKALEYLGLHTADGGLPGSGGLPTDVVVGLFERYDKDQSGHVDYEEVRSQTPMPRHSLPLDCPSYRTAVPLVLTLPTCCHGAVLRRCRERQPAHGEDDMRPRQPSLVCRSYHSGRARAVSSRAKGRRISCGGAYRHTRVAWR